MVVAFRTKGADIEERTMPDCYGFRDDKDPSCKRCKVKEECLARQAETRPTCFGTMYSADSEECARCIDASQCIDALEDTNVSDKKRFKIRRLVPTNAEVVAKPDVEEVEDAPVAEAPENVKAQDYTEWSIPELREELESRTLSGVGSKSKLIRRLLADDAGEPMEVVSTAEVDEFVNEKRVVGGGAKSDEPVDDKLDLSSILMALQEGQAVVVTRLVGAQWRFEMTAGCCASPVAVAPKISKSGGLKGSAYWDVVLSNEFKNFHKVDAGSGKGWDAMTEEERVAYADKIGVQVEPHPAPKVFAMHLSEAVLAKLGIEKYKPEYQSRAARNAIKA